MASFARTSSHSCFMTVATTSGKAAAPLPARRGTMVAQAVAAPRRKTSAMRKGVSTSSAATTTTTASPSSSSSSSTSSSAGGAASVRSNVVSATSLHASGPQPRLFAQEVLAGTVMGFWETRERNQGKKTRGPRRSSRWRRPVFSRKRQRTSAFYRIATQSWVPCLNRVVGSTKKARWRRRSRMLERGRKGAGVFFSLSLEAAGRCSTKGGRGALPRRGQQSPLFALSLPLLSLSIYLSLSLSFAARRRELFEELSRTQGEA